MDDGTMVFTAPSSEGMGAWPPLEFYPITSGAFRVRLRAPGEPCGRR